MGTAILGALGSIFGGGASAGVPGTGLLGIGAGTGSLLGGGLGMLGSLLQSGASGRAARDQLIAAQQAAAEQQNMLTAGLGTGTNVFNVGAGGLQPFIQGGTDAMAQLRSRLPDLSTMPGFTSAADVAKLPGFDFIKRMGEEATANMYAGKGWGVSGAAMKGATDYAEGLASTNFQQLWQDLMSGKSQAYNMLSGAAGIGTNAAQSLMGGAGSFANSILGAFGNVGQGIAGSIGAGGQAGAAGILGSTNALTQGLGNLGQGIMGYGVLNTLLQNNALRVGGLGGGGLGGGYSGINNAMTAGGANMLPPAFNTPQYGGS